MAKKSKGKQALAAAHQHGAPDNLAAATAPPHNPFVGQALLDSLDQTDAPLATSSPSVQTPNVAADPKTAVATGAHSKLTRKQKRKLKKEQQQHPASKSKSPINKDDNPTRMSKAQRKKRKRGRKRQLDAVLEALAVAESAATMSKSYLAVPNLHGTDERDALANLHGTNKRHMYAPKHTVKINTALAHQMPFPQAAPTTASIAAPTATGIAALTATGIAAPTATGIAAPTTASVTPNEQPPSGALAAQHPLTPSWQNAYPPGLRSMQNMPPSYWQSYANAAPNPYAPYPWLMPPVPPQGHEHTGQTGGVPLPAPPVPLPGNSRPPTQQPPWRNREAHGLLRPQMDSSAKQHHPMSLRPRIPRRSRSPRKERSEKIEIEGHGPDWAVRVPPVPVPVPTAKYLAQAKREPTRLSRPQHLLIVTDLNGTLICRSKTSKGFQPRPDLGYFLKHVFTDHAVMVWSSARPETVARTCEKIFTPADRSALCAEWSRDQLDLTPEQYAEKVQVYKRLSYIWETAEQEEWHPQHAQGGRYGAHNTLLLDDSVLKASSEPHNLVEVPEFEGGPMEKQARTGVLRQVMTYLDEVARWDNAAAFVKRNPFKLNTSSVGSWDRWEPSHGAP